MIKRGLSRKKTAFIASSIFLFLCWFLGFDGITFSDDVYYLLAGKRFWEGEMVFNDYHFSTRWGAYIPSGLIGLILGFNPHLISLISLISYLVVLWVLIKILPQHVDPWILVIWYSSQVYFLHFLTKVYPDSLLVFWIILIPVAAVYRNNSPLLAAFVMVSGFFFGFLTKETIVFLAPFPFVLVFLDWRRNKLNPVFYKSLVGIGIGFGTLYLGYFWLEFGNPFYRFESIQDGHYISEFTYADKNNWVMLKRLTVLPVITFVERSYWTWIIFAIPGVIIGLKSFIKSGFEFALAFLTLLICFWLMSTNLRFYNPLYLNPRHLIILVPILSYLVAIGWNSWQISPRIKKLMLSMMVIGILISITQEDSKMIFFQVLIVFVFLPSKLPYRTALMATVLIAPAIFSFYYQKNLKEYPTLIKSLTESTHKIGTYGPVLTNNFIEFSEEILLDSFSYLHPQVIAIENIDSLKHSPPEKLQVILYQYFKHAYPKEQVDVDNLEKWLNEEYKLTEEKKEGLASIRYYKRGSLN